MHYNIKEHGKIKKLIQRIRSMKTATLFLVIGGAIGLGFIIVTPPFQGWDEREHFYRASQVADLNIQSEVVVAPNAANVPGTEARGYGGYFPSSMVQGIAALHRNENAQGVYNYSLIGELNKTPASVDQQRAVRFDNTAIYSPAGYIPQSFAIAVSKGFNASFVEAFYAARAAGFVFWLVLMYMAIRLVPVGKKVFMVLALNPVSLFLATTLSPDALAAGYIAVIAALLLRATNQKKRMPVGLLFVVGVLMLLTVLIKNVYLPIVLSLFFVPRAVMGHVWKAVIITACTVATLAWNVSILNVTSEIPEYFGVTENVGAAGQVEAMLHNPIKFIGIVLWNIFGTNSILINQTYAGIFDRNPVPDWVVVAWLVTLVAVMCYKEKSVELMKERLKKRITWNFSIVSFMIAGLIVVSLYLGWSIIGDKDIIGVQGRYFIPISFLIVVPFILSTKYFVGTHVAIRNLLVFLILPAALIATVGSLLVRYTVGI